MLLPFLYIQIEWNQDVHHFEYEHVELDWRPIRRPSTITRV
jgi:hypothetical protein